MSNSVVLERLPKPAATHYTSRADSPRRQRVYIFPTRYGLIFSVNLLVMLIGAINYNNSLAYALTFLLGGLFLIAMLHTYSNLRGLIINASPAEPVFAGQIASFPLIVNNRSGKIRLAIKISQPEIRKKFFRKKKYYRTLTTLNLHADSIHSTGLEFATTKRGYLYPGRVRISSNWPLGLFQAWSNMTIEQGDLVYPKPAGRRTLPATTAIDEDEQTGSGSGTEDFVGVRQYRNGDSMRSVDWKAYARERGLHSKRFSGKGSRKILLDWSQTESLTDIEARLSQLCLWLLEAEKSQCQYALQLPGAGAVTFAQGEAHKQICLSALATYGLKDEQP
ncbi:MAG: DUF58 domain-containing protein [Gammaproteobacteria bacterium]|nr:DUF58 domain-containing protein [Gammaproteobacteria bacterium]